jgi:hypothetical protein
MPQKGQPITDPATGDTYEYLEVGPEAGYLVIEPFIKNIQEKKNNTQQ